MNSGSPNSAKSDGDATPDPPPDRRRDGPAGLRLRRHRGRTAAPGRHAGVPRPDPARIRRAKSLLERLRDEVHLRPGPRVRTGGKRREIPFHRLAPRNLDGRVAPLPQGRPDRRPRTPAGPRAGRSDGTFVEFRGGLPAAEPRPGVERHSGRPGAGHGGGAGRLGTGPGKGRGAGIPAGLPLPAALQRQREALRRGGAHGRPVHPRTPGDPALAHRRGAGHDLPPQHLRMQNRGGHDPAGGAGRETAARAPGGGARHRPERGPVPDGPKPSRRRPAGLLPADLLLRPDLLVAGQKPGQDDDHGGLRRRKRLSRPLRRDGRPDLLRPGAGHRGDLLQAATRRRLVPDQGRFRDRGAGQRLQGDAHAGHGVFRTA